jgi:hypothetical protein
MRDLKIYTHAKRKAMSDVEAINAIADACERRWAEEIPVQVHLFDKGVMRGNTWPVLNAAELSTLEPLIKSYIVKGERFALVANFWTSNQKNVLPSLAEDRRDISMAVLFSPSGKRIAARWEVENGKLLPRLITEDVTMRFDAEIAERN